MSIRERVVLASCVAAFAGCGEAVAKEPATALVRVYENSKAGLQVPEASRASIDAILSRAGVALVWRRCEPSVPEPHCAAAPLANEVVVRLMPGPPSVSEHGCGVALVPEKATAHYVTLFIDCVRKEARRLQVAEDIVLAYCLAHEIGHIFMGASHASDGLMQARPRPIDWLRAAHGGLGFAAGEARRLRARLTR